MKVFVIFLIVGFVGLIPFQHVFAHGVTELYGAGGCPVNSCGITDWDLYRTASDSMFYLSFAVYGLIATLFCYYLCKRKSVFTIVRK